MKNKQIMIVEKKQISSIDKAKLAKAGVIVVEAENPDKVRILSIAENVNANDYLMAALHSIAADPFNGAGKKFAEELYRRLIKNEKILNEVIV